MNRHRVVWGLDMLLLTTYTSTLDAHGEGQGGVGGVCSPSLVACGYCTVTHWAINYQKVQIIWQMSLIKP